MKEKDTLRVCDMEIELAKKQDKPAHWYVYKTYFEEIEKIIREKLLFTLKNPNDKN